VTTETDGDWGEYRRLILQELQRLHDGITDVKTRIDVLHASDLASIKSEIAVLKFKAGVWGLVAGAIPGVAALLYTALHK
jgi:hypothetical protein